MDRKGNLDDMLVPILLFIIAIAVVVGYIILDSASGAFSQYQYANNLISAGKLFFSRVGNVSFIFMAIALILFNVLGAYILVTYPAFMVIDIILFPLSILVASVMSNAYESTLYTLPVTSVFPAMSFIMLHLPIIIVGASILTAIAAYALIKR